MFKPICFVLMPFGKKTISSGVTVNFDDVYSKLIQPAIEAADLEPLRADEEMCGGLIHKPMYERLILCDFAVADLTGANPNVYYELGLRHGIRPATTALLFSGSEPLPFDVAPLRAFPYRLNPDGGVIESEELQSSLRNFLEEAKSASSEPVIDSPVFQLVEGYRAPEIDHLKTDVFRERAQYATSIKKKLERARAEGKAAIRAFSAELGDIEALEAGIVIDLLLSYRAVSDFEAMVDLVEAMPKPISNTILVREQYAFALNRIERGTEAESELLSLIQERGPSSETNGLLGRVYKDRWENAANSADNYAATGWLKKAIETYLEGFEADWRDAFPGINAVTLMELAEPPDPRRLELHHVVTYAVKRRLSSGKPDYWDHATLLELAVLSKNESEATSAIQNALTAVREPFEPETTARNLGLIRKARDGRGESLPWANDIEDTLKNKHSELIR